MPLRFANLCPTNTCTCMSQARDVPNMNCTVLLVVACPAIGCVVEDGSEFREHSQNLTNLREISVLRAFRAVFEEKMDALQRNRV